MVCDVMVYQVGSGVRYAIVTENANLSAAKASGFGATRNP